MENSAFADTSWNPDPVYFNELDRKWYFWDEVWIERYGAYETEQEARDALEKYKETL